MYKLWPRILDCDSKAPISKWTQHPEQHGAIAASVHVQVPRSVNLLQMKQENLVHRSLENIKVDVACQFACIHQTETESCAQTDPHVRYAGVENR